MRLPSPAKINLSLKVGAVDETGYHPVDTVIHLLEFGDTITFEPADDLSVTCSVDLGIAPEKNLVYQAAILMGEMFEKELPFHIHIEKRIPHGAGLGGGSSNAATVISGLGHFWGIAVDDERLLSVARSLGSDVAVFLAPTTCSRMVGYGEVFEKSLPPRTGQPVVLVMVPDAHASTVEVYQVFDRVGASQPTPPLINDLTKASIEVCPATGEALEWFRAQSQTIAVQVSGSGAACFAFTESGEDAKALAEAADAQGFWSVATTLG